MQIIAISFHLSLILIMKKSKMPPSDSKSCQVRNIAGSYDIAVAVSVVRVDVTANMHTDRISIPYPPFAGGI